MKTFSAFKPLFIVLSAIAVASCTSVPNRFDGADEVRTRLNALESNQSLANMAPMAIKDARTAVLNAEQSGADASLSAHLIFIAERKVDIAEAESQQRYLEEQRSDLKSQRDSMQLDARINESELAKIAARQAKQEAEEAQRQAAQAQMLATQAQRDLSEAERQIANERLKAQDIQNQLDEMSARNSARGAVVTLGDLLFDFNKSDIKDAGVSHLAKLAAFLNANTDRNVIIEGHTDNVGTEAVNMALSQRRADAVKNYLLSQGIAENRLQTSGKGASLPITDNTTADKRQQNRRVEVIISNLSV